MLNEVVNRELGRSRPSAFANRVRASRLSSIKLSNNKEIVSLHKGGVNTLQVDLTEGRYLLSGASDGSAAVYDIQQASSYESNTVAKHRPLFLVDKNVQGGHSYAISSAVWYPVDTGLFVTGSYDQYVKVWDTNMTQVEMSFKMPGKVYGIAMSSMATSHMLIATGTEDVQVRLCDIASGAFTHTLSGHRAIGLQREREKETLYRQPVATECCDGYGTMDAGGPEGGGDALAYSADTHPGGHSKSHHTDIFMSRTEQSSRRAYGFPILLFLKPTRQTRRSAVAHRPLLFFHFS